MKHMHNRPRICVTDPCRCAAVAGIPVEVGGLCAYIEEGGISANFITLVDTKVRERMVKPSEKMTQVLKDALGSRDDS